MQRFILKSTINTSQGYKVVALGCNGFTVKINNSLYHFKVSDTLVPNNYRDYLYLNTPNDIDWDATFA